MGNRLNKVKKKNNNNNNKKDNIPDIKENKTIEKIKRERYKYNILFLGEAGVGTKTSLIKRIIGEKFNDNFLFQKLILEKDDKEIVLYLINTHEEKGKNKYYGSLYAISDVIIIGYDVTNEQSFDEAKNFYLKMVKEKVKTNLIYLLGNKIDLKNEINVSEDKGKSFASLYNMKFFLISVKDDININNFIGDLTSEIEMKFKNDVNNRMNHKLNGKPIEKFYKTVFLGESGIGSKTSLINRIDTGSYEPYLKTTSCASYCNKSFSKNGENIILNMWDTVGQYLYRTFNEYFVVDSDIIVLGFDVTCYEDFREVKNYWYPLIKENSKGELVYLIGNKIDLREGGYEFENEVKNYAKENNIRYFPISCKNNIGIQDFINDLVNEAD